MKKLIISSFILLLYLYSSTVLGQISIVPKYFSAYGNPAVAVIVNNGYANFTVSGGSGDNGLGSQILENESRCKGFTQCSGKNLIVRVRLSGIQIFSQDASINIIPIGANDVNLSTSEILKKYAMHMVEKGARVQNLIVPINSLSTNFSKITVPVYDPNSNIAQVAFITTASSTGSPFFASLSFDVDSIHVIRNDGTQTFVGSLGNASVITDVRTNDAIPTEFSLAQNYPNPFNPTTNIKFDLPKESNVILKVYNILGEEVATLVNKVMPAGQQVVTFNASQLASGMYIYRMEADNFVQVKKMMLTK
ncbi:MAG: T9SS type A sorting domain-containing protein [Patescibacteria group bacterium]|nr:T9SS type A sorting domain-containing protein [Patescibacteria group bacterium]